MPGRPVDRLEITRIENPAARPARPTWGPGELRIDRQTLRDLGIMERHDGGAGLFRTFDRARTRGGADVLRRRFLAPMSDAARIRAVQASLRFILEHRAAFDSLPGQYVVSAFDHYFHWRVAPPISGGRLSAAVDALQLLLESYPQYQQIARGVRQTVRMVASLRRLTAEPATLEAPGELGVLLAEVRALVAHPALARLPAGEERWRIGRILSVDTVLRGEEREAVERLRDLLFEIDALAAMARATQEYGYVFPDVLDGPPQVAATGIVHPEVEDAIANPLDMDQSRRLLFLTGPNMAGKTTYLRACGIALYLAHLGMGVPARSFRFAPCDALVTAISLSDDVRAGISFFEAEALRARAIAEALAAGLKVVALLDEPFKGTNVKDALDASLAFLSRLARREGSLFLVSSHLIEAAEPLMATGTTACWRFEASERAGRLQFDYVLRAGVSAQRLGMRVLEEKGVFELLDRDG